jgi:hypothetical protein
MGRTERLVRRATRMTAREADAADLGGVGLAAGSENARQAERPVRASTAG